VVKRAGIETALRRLAPDIPDYEFRAVADHAMDSVGLRTASPETAAWLSMISFIRHVLTEYDALLEEGYEQDSARHFVADDIKAVLKEWGVNRPFGEND
jgi:hypothetical protein